MVLVRSDVMREIVVHGICLTTQVSQGVGLTVDELGNNAFYGSDLVEQVLLRMDHSRSVDKG